METVGTWLHRTAQGKYYYARAGEDGGAKLHEGLFGRYGAAADHLASYLAGELIRLHETTQQTLREPPKPDKPPR